MIVLICHVSDKFIWCGIWDTDYFLCVLQFDCLSDNEPFLNETFQFSASNNSSIDQEPCLFSTVSYFSILYLQMCVKKGIIPWWRRFACGKVVLGKVCFPNTLRPALAWRRLPSTAEEGRSRRWRHTNNDCWLAILGIPLMTRRAKLFLECSSMRHSLGKTVALAEDSAEFWQI